METLTLSPRYEAAEVEAKWYGRWEAAGLFAPDPDPAKPRYTITIPPPNITGSLHMGHCLCYGIQDLLGRYWRLRGHSVLVLPGQDHAGIATQSVVAKQLRKEGVNPVDLGRERFVERVWAWREESGSTIMRQFRQLGCAFDWSRERFTLDEGYARAVLKVFIDWFDAGIIYRGFRVVNWDPALQTSVSDIETERKTLRGHLTHIYYPYAESDPAAWRAEAAAVREGAPADRLEHGVIIATTRPETMLADVAVAVHPSDERYKRKIGRALRLPLMDREIPLIADPYPDPEFGTGAVKITPAHDPNDYEVGVRHGLPMPVVLDDRAHVNELGGPYAGLERYEARKRVVADLQSGGYLIKQEAHEIPMIYSERSGEAIEPLLKEQWFARQTELARPAIEAVRDGRIRFVPERYDRIFLDWMENIRDWNISRKLWWGHRIPVYTTESGRHVAAQSWEEAEAKSGEKVVAQDDEVLDTWFSSGLWPFATLGWPEQTADLAERYPTQVLITDRNIINTWVARMAMMGLHYMPERVPFHQVYIHATVMNEHGQRMSKSLGTGVDPVETIERIGADALRMTLLGQAGMTQEIRYSDKKTEAARNFCNKIWNATRFALMNLDGFDPSAVRRLGELPLTEVDRWLLSRLAGVEAGARAAYEGYDVQQAAMLLESFFWGDLCDWYIEVSKPRLADPAERAVPQAVLVAAFEAFLAMMHPIMPFITEEIYSHLPLPDRARFLMAGRWPDHLAAFADPDVESVVTRWFEATRALRALRAEVGLDPRKAIEAAYAEGDLRGGGWVLASQAWVGELREGRPEGKFISATVQGLDLHLPIEGLIDEEKEIARLVREEEKATKDLDGLEARLSNPQFVERAKAEVIERDRAAALELRERLEKIRARRALFERAP
jgi:valyl-tRNA synthetase